MDKVWEAKWIMDEDFYGLKPINVFHKQLSGYTIKEHKPELKNRHMLVRKKFFLTDSIEAAFIDITADDYYKLYINERFVGQGPAPSYHFKYNYNKYDITNYLKQGENLIAVHVYYQGLVNRVWNSGDYRQGLIAELFINKKLYLYTDKTWKYTLAKEFIGDSIFGYETQYAENIDSRLKVKSWNRVEFDDSSWRNACIKCNDDHRFSLQITPPVQVYNIKPVKVEMIKKDHYIIDFGHEITGQFEMRAKGISGQKIEIRYGEELNDSDGSVRYEMRCNCRYTESWIMSGENDLLELYDYKAFRYVEIIAPVEIVDEKSFSARVRHYPFDDGKCVFSSSNEELNKIWEICKKAVKYSTQEIYLDCPSREKGQYIGDALITAKAHLYLTGDLRIYRKAIEDFALSSYICPGLMAVAPGSYMQEIADYSLQWPQMLLDYYWQSGERSFLKEMYPIAEGIINYFGKYKRADGLLENVNEKWNLVDWPGTIRDGYDFELSHVVGNGCHNVINAFYLGAIKTIDQIRDILDLEYKNEFPDLRKAFIKSFYNRETGLFVDSTVSKHCALHSNAIPLYYDLIPESSKVGIVDFIKQKKMCCGVYIAYYLLKGLAQIGEHDLVYDLIISDGKSSWINMLREGATTCFEVWGKDQKINASLCHPWASAPIIVLIEDIIGLKPVEPGWKITSNTAHIPEKLKEISLKMTVKSGEVNFVKNSESQ